MTSAASPGAEPDFLAAVRQITTTTIRTSTSRDCAGRTRCTAHRHLAFGGGGHFCLGAPLAKMTAEVAVSELFRRFPHMELVDTPVRTRTLTLRGLTSLAVENCR